MSGKLETKVKIAVFHVALPYCCVGTGIRPENHPNKQAMILDIIAMKPNKQAMMWAIIAMMGGKQATTRAIIAMTDDFIAMNC